MLGLRADALAPDAADGAELLAVLDLAARPVRMDGAISRRALTPSFRNAAYRAAMFKRTAIIIAAAATAGCSGSAASDFAPADPDYAEMEQLKAWGRQLKAEDRDTTRLLMRECWGEGSLMTAEGKLAIMRCMRRKYDEGDRATRSW